MENQKQPRSNETKKLLAFAEAVTRNIRLTLEKSSKPKRRVNHRKYMQRKVKQTDLKTTSKSSNKLGISKTSRSKTLRPMARTQRSDSNSSSVDNIPYTDENFVMFAETLENIRNNEVMQYNCNYVHEYSYGDERFNFQGASMYDGYDIHCPNIENVQSEPFLCPNRTQSYNFNHQEQQPYCNVPTSPPRLSHYNCANIYLERHTPTSSSLSAAALCHSIPSPCEILSETCNAQNGQAQYMDSCISMFAGQDTFDNDFSHQLGQFALSVPNDWHWLSSANHMGLWNGQGLVTT